MSKPETLELPETSDIHRDLWQGHPLPGEYCIVANRTISKYEANAKGEKNFRRVLGFWCGTNDEAKEFSKTMEATPTPVQRSDPEQLHYGKMWRDGLNTIRKSQEELRQARMRISVLQSHAHTDARVKGLREALKGLVALYEDDEGSRSLPEYKNALAALNQPQGDGNGGRG